ncbi:MAG: aminodeoxychorismate/anthranilate synthase component II [Bacteroidales bacterium]|nr:aminodeoxychorismate/anthranilate synthase component II [Bacteroidales bacterium]MBN2818077.1 aminodeoxychorismate/anthranilate synthase component II [Bacteroidales bacterium]
MNILVLDNYDSFTYNLVHYIENLTDGDVIDVFRNDEIALDEVDKYDKILLSPGPGIPEEAGILLDLIKKYAPTKSIFGVCLGHQAIAEAFGGSLINLDTVYHGVSTFIDVVTPDDILYKSLPGRFEVGRYHSWAVSRENLPSCFKINSLDEHGMIMGITHKEYDVRGVQYHPESVLTPEGLKIVENWLRN